MRYTASCPQCQQTVSLDDKSCPHCAASLTKMKFKPGAVLLYGAISVVVAWVMAVLIPLLLVPLVIIGTIVCMFLRDKLHVIKYHNDSGSAPPPAGKVAKET